MKKLKRFVIVFLCVAFASLLLGGCEKTSSQIEAELQEEIKAENLEDVRQYTENYFAATMKAVTYDQFKDYADAGQVIVSYPFDNDWGSRWKYFTDKHGAVKEAVVDQVDKTEHGFTGRVILTGEDDGQMAFVVTYDSGLRPISTQIGEYADDSQESLASKMATAGGNTVTGLLVVFVILVGLSLIISCFKFIGRAGEVKPENKDAAKKAAPAEVPAAAPAAPAASAASGEVDPAKDQELVAVIAAAIAAAENKPVEGYQVRSIKRLRSNKWR